MQPGRMDRRIAIEAVAVTQNDYGEEVETWAPLATVFAEKRDIRARERFTAQQRLAEESAVFVIRYRADVTPAMRLVCEGKTYRIEGLAEIGRREGLEITATAEVLA